VSPLDREVLAEKAAAVERHLSRVKAHLPARSTDLDMKRVYEAATKGPADLRAFLAAVRDRL